MYAVKAFHDTLYKYNKRDYTGSGVITTAVVKEKLHKYNIITGGITQVVEL